MKLVIHALLSFVFMTCATRANEVEVGSVTICDTQRQIERFAELFEGNFEVTVKAVNDEEKDPNACAMVEVAYVQGISLGIIRNKSKSHAFRIIPILVVGVNKPGGLEPIPSHPFFSVVCLREFWA